MMACAVIGLGGALGLIGGSFATTAALRAVRGESWAMGRSHCDHCRASLAYVETVPLASYVWSRGACRRCGGAIAADHPAGEATGALCGALAFALPLPQAALLLVLALLLLASAVTDTRSRTLPDCLTVAAAGAALVLAALRGLQALALGAVVAAAVGIVLLGLRAWTCRGGRPPGLGLGDVKLAVALSIWLGPLSPWALAIASILGLATCLALRPADGRIAFGPMLAIAGWAVGWTLEAGLWPDMA